MIIRLTWSQWAAIRTRIPPEIAVVMLERRQARGRAHDYLLPAIGWRRVLDALVETCYGPLGGMTQGGRNVSVYRAIKKIADAVGHVECHPALTPGMGVVGINTVVIPAWQIRNTGAPGSVIRSPYPEDGWEFVVMRPGLISQGGRDITIWSARSPNPENVLEDEGFHILLAGSVQLSG